MIGIDGCFLKGVLVTAIGRDENGQMYPIAWAVVESENLEAWRWFIELLQKDLELHDGQGFTIISDQHPVSFAALFLSSFAAFFFLFSALFFFLFSAVFFSGFCTLFSCFCTIYSFSHVSAFWVLRYILSFQSIISVVRTVIPTAEHRFCVRHLFCNWAKKFKGDEVKIQYWNCVRATCVRCCPN